MLSLCLPTLPAAAAACCCGAANQPSLSSYRLPITTAIKVVYEWALGTPFGDICGLTDVMEGSIVRAIVRLDQACRELMDAARVMGDTALFAQMEAASAAIKRDVIFAASLYVA